jgi:hypothetical protein
MKPLNKLYEQQLEELANAIQDSEILESYLEEEDEELYKELIETFEPAIDELYHHIALNEPLQILALEDLLINPVFEGLYLPRLLGYNILREEVDSSTKYTRSNEGLQKILKSICDSANFEIIKNRVGQAIQIGFALSSDIWITGFIDQLTNKKIKQYLLAQKLPKYFTASEREKGLKLFQLQYKKFNFYTTQFPSDLTTQRIYFHTMCTLLKERAVINEYNSTFLPEYINYLEKSMYHHTKEHTIILGLLINYFDLKESDQGKLAKVLNVLRDANDFNDIYFNFILERFNSKLKLSSDSDMRVAKLVDFKKTDDELARYYTMASTLAQKGYMHEETIEQVREVYGMYEGMSLFNECVRKLVLGHFERFIINLDPDDYTEYIEVDKYLRVYIDIFNNQHFNQSIRDYAMKFVSKCLKQFSDKRSREYQDVKKFVSQQFIDLDFMREKDLVEIFKTKRKRKPE